LSSNGLLNTFITTAKIAVGLRQRQKLPLARARCASAQNRPPCKAPGLLVIN